MTDLTLVVTKPKLPDSLSAQKRLLQDALESCDGFDTFYLPVFKLSPKQAGLEKLAAFVGPSAHLHRIAVFVSPSSLEFGLQGLDQWPADLFCGVMGRQSAALAERLGVPKNRIIAPGVDDNQESEDSTGLFNILKAGHRREGSRVMVCKGPMGRDEFPIRLREAGFEVDVVETYDRQPITQSPSELERLLGLKDKAVLWITSSQTALVLMEQLRGCNAVGLAAFQSSAWVLTTHPRITSQCKQLGFERVFEVPTGMEAVKTWMTQTALVRKASAAPLQSPPQISAPPTMTTTQQQTSASPVLAKAAFVMSLIALVLLVLMLYFNKDQLERTRQAFGERIQKESTTLEMLESQVSEANGGFRELKGKLELLEKGQAEASSQRAALEEVYNNLLARKSVVSVSEVEQLISIARRQLFVLGNVNGAKIALGQALELLERTDRPLLLSLRAAIEKDLAELNALPEVNLLEYAIELDSVIESVPTLPMLSGSNTVTDMTLAEFSHGGPGKQAVEPVLHNPNPLQWLFSGLGRLFSTAWEDIKGLVEITRVDKPEVLLISAKDSSDLRNAMRLSMLNARLSLLSRHPQLLKNDVERSKKMLDAYFDGKSPQVARAKDILTRIEKLEITLALPELKNSSSALRLALSGEGEKQ